ncbi:MAG TPA: hypothetical protein PLY87_09120 [Planctomycetaceae bacterium]|nr:hypothetical protein [Planctomycetaceae bacterium]HQZ65224.1 hypothetical protein [Planctomycetaceae bacterium]
MKTHEANSEVQAESELYGRVVGVMKHRTQLKSMCESLTALGVNEVDIFDGPTGIQRLGELHKNALQYFFGDMEAVLLQSYLDAAGDDQIVFAAVVDPEFANQAASLAKSQGATQVAHFGNSVITNY